MHQELPPFFLPPIPLFRAPATVPHQYTQTGLCALPSHTSLVHFGGQHFKLSWDLVKWTYDLSRIRGAWVKQRCCQPESVSPSFHFPPNLLGLCPSWKNAPTKCRCSLEATCTTHLGRAKQWRWLTYRGLETQICGKEPNMVYLAILAISVWTNARLCWKRRVQSSCGNFSRLGHLQLLADYRTEFSLDARRCCPHWNQLSP